MLTLLTGPAWAPADAPPQPLPLTVPAALLLVLATRAGWVTREELALVFWPDAAPADALHHLRINLHRAKQLLAVWNAVEALQSERARVRLALPSDLAALRAAQASGDSAVLTRMSPAGWLQGWRLAGYAGFAQWCEDTHPTLQAEWLEACRRRRDAPAGQRAAAVSAPWSASTLADGPDVPDAAPVPSVAASAGVSDAVNAPPGRAQELQQLLHNPAAAVLLLGEPGAGKTTLLQATFPGVPLLRGLEGLHAMPYRPLLDVLRSHIGTLARLVQDPAHPLRPYRLDLARVLPELAPDEALPPLDAMTARTRLVEALTRGFEALTPVLLVDDLQWCDTATVEWLLMLAHSGRLPWRAAARRHEVGEALQASLDGLHAANRLALQDVGLLTREALAQACASRWPHLAHDAGILDRLHALSGGNAFLLGELVKAGLGAEDDHLPGPVHVRIARLVLQRLEGLPQPLRAAVEQSAVFVQPVPAAALIKGLDTRDEAAQALWTQRLQRAVSAGLLREDGGGRLVCRHDLVRQAVAQALPAMHRAALHRHAALWLASQSQTGDEPPDALTIAEHWRLAGDTQTALAWCHRGAEQLKSRGSFSAAKALWREVAEASLDATQSLRAQLELAACDLFEDLARGEAALEAVQARLGAVADPEQHRQIEARLRSALVDNRVFAGDIPRAQVHAQRLRQLLPALPVGERVDAIEVLIELAMREPDIPAAWALLAQLRSHAPQRPSLLSWEGQIHWFGGQVQAAHDALARLLERHPEYCSGITVENDLAVMLHALGRIGEAETMARRSLKSWAGVAHTETLSLLVLGLVLASAARFEDSDAALTRALQMAREQASPGFEAEALVRRARLMLLWQRPADAALALDEAAPLLAQSPEPLRVSQLLLAQVQAALPLQHAVSPALLERLQGLALRSSHPLVHWRAARVLFELARAAGDEAETARQAEQMVQVARRGQLQEALAESLFLQAMLLRGEPAARRCRAEAELLVARLGLAAVGAIKISTPAR